MEPWIVDIGRRDIVHETIAMRLLLLSFFCFHGVYSLNIPGLVF